MKLSIITPILNEADGLPALLAHLLPLIHHDVELILSDGGSCDGSIQIAERAGFTVIRAARGRAYQMNAAAAMAQGEIFLFLHADTQLPPAAITEISQALATGQYAWGRFNVRIIGRPRMLPVISHLMNLRSRLTGIATGDQALFMTRQAFLTAGGFPDQMLMEDIEISKRLRALTRPACIRHCVLTSGRRWEAQGVWRTIFLMWRLRWRYWRGVPADELAKAYR
ncbi:TIGR04283 family arsenosugar biosynthesis glycosyltransferase [Alcaligenaceae bacterium CGII-47]|nr:TIGR04283 family arsenosugar biosynthesis glycosyltransferase [Alcaligenaceae bacterium CGII-47]